MKEKVTNFENFSPTGRDFDRLLNDPRQELSKQVEQTVWNTCYRNARIKKIFEYQVCAIGHISFTRKVFIVVKDSL